MSESVIVYIDGLNFYNSVKGTSYKWVDLYALSAQLVPKAATLVEVKYFTAQISAKIAEDPRAPVRQRAYIRAVKAHRPPVTVIEGKFQVPDKWRSIATRPWDQVFRPKLPQEVLDAYQEHFSTHEQRPWKVRVQIPEEKFTDVAIASHLLRDFYRGSCDFAVVVSNDADLEPAIKLAVDDGHKVGVISPDPSAGINQDLQKSAMWARPLRSNLLKKHQMPDTVKTSKGRELHRPKEWK